MLIELTTFRLRDGIEDAAFLAADRAVQAELSWRQGFVRRTTARGEAGGWLVMTLWRSPGDADGANDEAAGDGPAGSFGALVDASSKTSDRYFSLD